MISPMRLVLAAAALLIIYIDPSQPDRLVGLTYSLLIGYTVYSAVVLLLSLIAPRRLPLGVLHWIDMIWYVALIAASSGTSSIFFLFFFFPILVASFRWGFASGLRTTIVSAILFITVGYLTAPEPNFELNRFLLRAVTLLVLGYMISHWGGSEIRLKHRLRLLKDVTNLSNPRFGISRTISLGLEALRSFYNARACILIYRAPNRAIELMRVDRGKSDPPLPKPINRELADLFLSPPTNVAVNYRKHSSNVRVYELESGETRTELLPNAAALANALGASNFVSIPVTYRGQFTGRLYVVDGQLRIDEAEVEFVLQSIQHVIPLLDNIGLLDRLASEAAAQERKKLARDIHDTVIQPYVGLQLGLMAIRQKLIGENSSAFNEVSELCEVANHEVRQLRTYLDELKAQEARYGVLFPAVRRFAEKYSVATGIAVEIFGEENLQLNDRLAAQVFQMIAEALSNVRRHSTAHRAEVEITCDATDLILNIRNENSNGAPPASFRPRSIAERADALGGTATINIDEANRTVVAIRIPL